MSQYLDVRLEIGEIAYRGYCANVGGQSLVSREPLPPWPVLSEEQRSAWNAAAKALVDQVDLARGRG